MNHPHSFHIPVMGVSFTIDSPLKVAKYGIDSVVSLVDDSLFEKLRKMYSEKFGLPFQEISENTEDSRAKRITAYLNFINERVTAFVDELKESAGEKQQEIKDYFNMLPDSSEIKAEFNRLMQRHLSFDDFKSWLRKNLRPGHIDVNIMTKVDKANFRNGKPLPQEYNDAHAALRGFAQSDLESSVILSAGMSPRLYSYIENFEDFFPDRSGYIKKKVVLKVSDFRSALIQGKFLAKKGIWVSEYRIESGLNCGGHAFATEGMLLGPILQEFKQHRSMLIAGMGEILMKALAAKGKAIPEKVPELKITVQGGVGTAEEHRFLMEEYDVDAVGWGTPFLLVEEATTVDSHTRNQLAGALEDDLILSGRSPLGVPFNSLKDNTKDIEKELLAQKGKPGSLCPKQYLVSNTEFTDKPICTASYRYQRLKIKELKADAPSPREFKKRYDKIVEKSCLCVGLRTSALLDNNLDRDGESAGVSVCPGPNMAYFNKKVSLKNMVDHIYGRTNIMQRTDRPNMFIKELNIYIKYLKDKIEEAKMPLDRRQEKSLINFAENLRQGIDYYRNMMNSLKVSFADRRDEFLAELQAGNRVIGGILYEIQNRRQLVAEPVSI